MGKYPKAVAIGLISQLLILPLIRLAIAKFLPMQPAIATGLMILALCPGGVSSNLVTFLAMDDVALSVTMTALSSLITVSTIPIFANLASQHFFGQGAVVELPIGTTIGQISAITFLPIAIGMSIRQFVPKLSTKLEKVTSISATILLAVIILELDDCEYVKKWEIQGLYQ